MIRYILTLLSAAFVALVPSPAASPAMAQETPCGAPAQWMCQISGLTPDNPVSGDIIYPNGNTLPFGSGNSELTDEAFADLCNFSSGSCRLDVDPDDVGPQNAAGCSGHGQARGRIVVKCPSVNGGPEKYYIENGWIGMWREYIRVE